MTGVSSDSRPERVAPLSWSTGLLFRRAGRKDWVAFTAMLACAVGVVLSGNMAARRVAPSEAKALGVMLDSLEMPRQFRDAPLQDEFGDIAGLYERAKTKRSIIAFYAPWCGPCQKELPDLYEVALGKLDLLVVISADEDPAATRQKLDNLGMDDLGFLVDIDGELQRDGRVTALPSTFLISDDGRILERMEGYSDTHLWRIEYRAGLRD